MKRLFLLPFLLVLFGLALHSLFAEEHDSPTIPNVLHWVKEANKNDRSKVADAQAKQEDFASQQDSCGNLYSARNLFDTWSRENESANPKESFNYLGKTYKLSAMRANDGESPWDALIEACDAHKSRLETAYEANDKRAKEEFEAKYAIDKPYEVYNTDFKKWIRGRVGNYSYPYEVCFTHEGWPSGWLPCYSDFSKIQPLGTKTKGPTPPTKAEAKAVNDTLDWKFAYDRCQKHKDRANCMVTNGCTWRGGIDGCVIK